MTSGPEPAAVRRKILRWYSLNRRPFPWRDTRDPYRILLSEIMLQQTQADRVAGYFTRFLKKFPCIATLARASKADVLRAWKGMGYNNRAVRLHGAVKEVMASYNGSVPRDTNSLSLLPGIGRYTAHAVACFAHGSSVPVVDVNVRRVLSRIFHRMETTGGAISNPDAWKLAARILPAEAYDWNQALMDFGAMVCTARNPKCSSCPVSDACLSAGRFRNAGITGPVLARTPGGNGRRRREDDTRSSKKEPSHRGIPRRIWRGKIVEALCGSRKPLATADIQRIVRPSGKAPSGKWLNDIIGRLERDGVVSVRRERGRIAVSLAP